MWAGGRVSTLIYSLPPSLPPPLLPFFSPLRVTPPSKRTCGVNSAWGHLFQVFEKLAFGSAGVSEEEDVDIPTDAVLVVDVFLDAGEEGEEEGELDFLVAVNGGGEGARKGGTAGRREDEVLLVDGTKTSRTSPLVHKGPREGGREGRREGGRRGGTEGGQGLHLIKSSDVLGAAAMRWMSALSSSVMWNMENKSSRL